ADELGHLFGRPSVGTFTADRAAEVVDDDLGPFLGQLEGLAPPDPVAGPGDDRDLAVEDAHVPSHSMLTPASEYGTQRIVAAVKLGRMSWPSTRASSVAPWARRRSSSSGGRCRTSPRR